MAEARPAELFAPMNCLHLQPADLTDAPADGDAQRVRVEQLFAVPREARPARGTNPPAEQCNFGDSRTAMQFWR